ncbi:MAG: DNA N-6-adenine-methyltransferase [Sandaracinaceae bacterium]
MATAEGPNAGTSREDWCTPRIVVDRLLAFAGSIALDPCSNPVSLVPATRRVIAPEDGLAVDWHAAADGGLVYVNPPFGRKRTGLWLGKAADEAERGAEIVVLIPARTDTRAWQRHAPRAAAICFWAGRMRFLGAKNGAPFPSALLYFGRRPGLFAHVFGAHGIVYHRPLAG